MKMRSILILSLIGFTLALNSCSPSGSVDEQKVSEDSVALDMEADSLLQAASAEIAPDTTAAVSDSSNQK